MNNLFLIKKGFGNRSGHIHFHSKDRFFIKPVGFSRKGKPGTKNGECRSEGSDYRTESKNYRIGIPVEQ